MVSLICTSGNCCCGRDVTAAYTRECLRVRASNLSLLWDPFPAAPRFFSRQRQGEMSITFSGRNMWCDKAVDLYPFSGFLTVQREQREQVATWHCLSGLTHERERWNSEGTQVLLSFGIGWKVCCYQVAVESKGKWPLSSLIKTFVNVNMIPLTVNVEKIVAKNFESSWWLWMTPCFHKISDASPLQMWSFLKGENWNHCLLTKIWTCSIVVVPRNDERCIF